MSFQATDKILQSSSEQHVQDSPTRQRIVGIDVARALAIMGMTCIHIFIVVSMFGIESRLIDGLLPVLSGRPATMFMILAGIGISLRCCNKLVDELQAVSSSLRRRGAFFLFVGLLNLVWWDGDILRVYGIGYFVASFFVRATNRILLGMAVSFIVIFLFMLGIFDFERNWNFENLEYQNIWTIQGAFANIFFNGFRAVFPWVGLLFFGMWIGRLDLLDRRVSRKAITLGLAVWAFAEISSAAIVSNVASAYPNLDPELIIALFGTDSLPALPLFLLSSCGLVIAIAFALFQICERWRYNRAITWVAAAGRMAFTWYIVHIAFVLGVAGYCIEIGPISPAAGFVVAAGFCLIMVVVSNWYLKKYASGPLEWLMRRVTDNRAKTDSNKD